MEQKKTLQNTSFKTSIRTCFGIEHDECIALITNEMKKSEGFLKILEGMIFFDSKEHLETAIEHIYQIINSDRVF